VNTVKTMHLYFICIHCNKNLIIYSYFITGYLLVFNIVLNVY